MKNKTKRFLTVSIILVSILCVCVFTSLAIRMNRKGAETIQDIGKIYMAGMSEKVARHFGTIMELRLSQVGALVDSVPPESTDGGSAMRVALTYNARARGFDYLALYTSDGRFDMIYGEQIEVEKQEAFLEAVCNGEEKVAAGKDSMGEDIVLMGTPTNYPMPNGETSVALVAGLPAQYISDTLSLELDKSVVYSIIRRNGSFIIKGDGMEEDNYFDRVENLYEKIEGQSAEQYISELSTAMEKNEDYTSTVSVLGERRSLYCTSLPYSDWHLLLSMHYGMLNEAIENLSYEWSITAIRDCMIVLAALALAFAGYFYLTGKQMRALEEAHSEAERASRAKSEFLSNMSHDIRTPMNGIVGMTAVAAANIDNKQQVQNCLKNITTSSRHLLGLINDILDMSKIESGKLTLNMEEVSLKEITQNIVKMIQPQVKEQEQEFLVHAHDIYVENVYSDSVRLSQVLLNLLGNAMKFTPKGGTVRLGIYEKPSPKGEAYIQLHLLVGDNGIGMSEEFQKKLFDSFMREDNTRVEKTAGAGLGMTITKYIVDSMEGTIEVKSAVGKGTEFHIILDLEKAEGIEAEILLPDWKVLLVDNDKMAAESAAISLNAMGVRTEQALDGNTAVEMAERCHKNKEDYDMVLVDWKMPEMNGIETTKKLRQILGKEIPILLVSANDWEEIEDDAKEAGINGFVVKPLFPSVLFYSLRRFADEEERRKLQPEEEADFTGKRILVAEDNDLNWEIASELLSDMGLELEWAENGELCAEKFQESEVGWYDAVLMDLRMPKMTGFEAAKAIRAMEREDAQTIPIIAMSADAFADDIQRCMDCGMNAHTAKPIDLLEISRLLEKYIL